MSYWKFCSIHCTRTLVIQTCRLHVISVKFYIIPLQILPSSGLLTWLLLDVLVPFLCSYVLWCLYVVVHDTAIIISSVEVQQKNKSFPMPNYPFTLLLCIQAEKQIFQIPLKMIFMNALKSLETITFYINRDIARPLLMVFNFYLEKLCYPFVQY